MTVETINNGIEDLDNTLPSGTDPKSEGDNHLRNTKLALGLSFPNTSGPWNTTSEISAGGFNANLSRVRNVGTPTDQFDAVRKGDNDATNTRIDDAEARITVNENDIVILYGNDAAFNDRITTSEDDIAALQAQAATFSSFGNVDAAGIIQGGSGDFAVTKVGTGQYNIIFTEAASGQYAQSLSVMPQGVPPFSLARSIDVIPISTTTWGVYIYQSNNGAQTDAAFTFSRLAD